MLGVGMCVAWYALGNQFAAYYNAAYTFAPPIHPVLTPCFYGSCAFVIVFVWALLIVFRAQQMSIWLVRLLAFCTVFAGAVVLYESLMYAHIIPTFVVNCSPGVHPLRTPCFTGLLFFAVSYVLARAIVKHEKITLI
jgi:hypothetical protein